MGARLLGALPACLPPTPRTAHPFCPTARCSLCAFRRICTSTRLVHLARPCETFSTCLDLNLDLAKPPPCMPTHPPCKPLRSLPGQAASAVGSGCAAQGSWRSGRSPRLARAAPRCRHTASRPGRRNRCGEGRAQSCAALPASPSGASPPGATQSGRTLPGWLVQGSGRCAHAPPGEHDKQPSPDVRDLFCLQPRQLPLGHVILPLQRRQPCLENLLLRDETGTRSAAGSCGAN